MQPDSAGATLIRELAYPLTDTAVLIAIGAFTLLTLLAMKAGIFGLWLAVILLPALSRYLLMLLEARAEGRPTPVASIETFNPFGHVWSLTPLLLVALAVWGSVFLQRQAAPLAGQAFAVLVMAILPASAAVLALTRSPPEALDPRAILRLIVACGPAYGLAPLALGLGVGLIAVLGAVGAPAVVPVAAAYYLAVLVFTLTGALLRRKGVQLSISLPESPVAGEDSGRDRCIRSRRQALTHAYGFFARDNLGGGLGHIRDALEREQDEDEAWRWYLDEMFRWESTDAALMLGQLYLQRLLLEERDVEAVKLMSRCLLADPRFRPLASDRDAAQALAVRMKRAELVRAMDLAPPSVDPRPGGDDYGR